MVRKASIGEDGKKKGAWSPEEDNKLRNSVEILQKYGHTWNWRELPKYAGLSRCGRSCRFRWMNYLRPNVKHGNYSKEEEDLILKLHRQLGNKWSEIAARLPGRSDNEVKNHWHSHLKKRLTKFEITFEVPKEQSKQKSLALKDVANSLPPQPIFESSSLTSSLTLSCGEPTSLIFEPPMAQSEQMCSELVHEGFVNSLPQPLLGSTMLSRAPSFGELSSFICDYPLSDETWIAEDDINSTEFMFQEPYGNFWTEENLVDSFNRYNGSPLQPDEGRSMSPDPEYLHFDEFFYQALQDFLEDGNFS